MGSRSTCSEAATSCYMANTELLRSIVEPGKVPTVEDNQPYHINAALHELMAGAMSHPEFGQSGVALQAAPVIR